MSQRAAQSDERTEEAPSRQASPALSAGWRRWVRAQWVVPAAMLMCVASSARAEPVKVTVTGSCPAAVLAERTERELRLEGFEPTDDKHAVAELHIRRSCTGGFNIQIRDRETGTVLHEHMEDAPIEEVALHAVELLRAVTATRAAAPSPDEPEAPVTMELADEPTSAPAANDITGLEKWEGGRPADVHPACRASCRDRGLCLRVNDGSCVAEADNHCFWSTGCRDEGRCRAVAGVCLATQDRDCQRSRACRERGDCTASVDSLRCADERPRRSGALFALGIVGVSMSGLATAGGLVYVGLSARAWGRDEDIPNPTPAYVLLGIGLPALALSLTGVVYGGAKPESEDGRLPTISISPTGGSLTWTF